MYSSGNCCPIIDPLTLQIGAINQSVIPAFERLFSIMTFGTQTKKINKMPTGTLLFRGSEVLAIDFNKYIGCEAIATRNAGGE